MSEYINSEHERLTVPVEYKFVKSHDDEDEGGGIIEGHASIFGNIDLGHDIVEKGAFKKTIKDRVKRGLVKLLANHDMWSLDAILGSVLSAKEDDIGLFFRARLSTVQAAQDVKTKIKEGHITKLSFGFDILKHRFETIKGQSIRIIEEAKLWEISIVGFPMNEMAEIDSVKSIPIPYQDLPVAPDSTAWDSDGAEVRIKRWSGESNKKSMAYLGIDKASGREIMPIADVIKGRLMVIPAAVIQLAENIEKDDNFVHLKAHLDRYIDKFDSEDEPETPLAKDGNPNPEAAEPEPPLTVEALMLSVSLKLKDLTIMEGSLND